ncbi:metal-dependent phosphohydrolase [Pseudomonas phage UNO-G1W1]|uniref:Metal-dependent phosphohydrolase n=1 Tax=Pseudomonas phage UNO-G1W1 TaxID=3136609 RepID=A0AAX4MVW6_9CAUD
MTPRQMINKIADWATEKHQGQRYGAHAYDYHLAQVAGFARNRNDGKAKATIIEMVAWLHDVIEDTPVTYEQLLKEFGWEIAYPVLLLTKKEGQTYEEYMSLILLNDVAREVKTCDTMANLTNSMAGNIEKNILKYSRQLHILVKGEYYE